jgi:tetratricopeptide (TPR) repeat protein
MKTSLPHPNDIRLRAAEGWLELGNLAEARAELAEIEDVYKTFPEVVQLSYAIHQEAREWAECVVAASAFVELVPDHADGWITRSFALHELKRTREAHDLLLPAAKLFPKVWTIPYNLACYCAQLGELDASERWLARAKKIDKEQVEQIAAEDPDLKPLRDRLLD